MNRANKAYRIKQGSEPTITTNNYLLLELVALGKGFGRFLKHEKSLFHPGQAMESIKQNNQ